MAPLTLRERCRYMGRHYNINICASTLFKYYTRAGIVFRSVQLANVNKTLREAEIKRRQKQFVIDVMRVQLEKYVYWLDETSLSLW